MTNELLKSITDELLEKGSVTLTSKSRDEIYEQSEAVTKSLPEGTNWTRTLCQYHPDTFSYEQKITIKKK